MKIKLLLLALLGTGGIGTRERSDYHNAQGVSRFAGTLGMD